MKGIVAFGKCTVLTCAILGLLSFGGQSFAQTVRRDSSRADGLVDACKAAVNSSYGTEVYPTHFSSAEEIALASGYCTGYLNGFVGGTSMMAAKGGKAQFCLPKDVSIDEIAKVLIKGLDDKPQFGSAPSLGFVIGILTVTWPCQ
jgi:Rap1a immunity proteins